MADDERISPGMREFIESMGVYFERYGLARIGGRILGLLMVADRPLSLDDMANTLLVSRASVSTNIRLAVASGLAELVSLAGDRRDYYRFSQDAWERATKVEIEGILALRRIAERGLVALEQAEGMARTHLDDVITYCDFVIDDRRALLERIQARRRAEERA
jgi:DNA-binding transcriptional regulator GbsR (MarR family)